jgi:hypothetical protein
MGDVRFRLGRGASGRFKWMGLVPLVSVWVVWAAAQKRRRDAALQSDRGAGDSVANGQCVTRGAARQVHWFNIPFGVARESNSLHSKRMKESSNQARQKPSTSR